MNFRAGIILVLAVAGCLWACESASAKGRGAISGRVVGPDGMAVAGARVSTSFSDVVSGTGRITLSGPDGTFRIGGLRGGAYVNLYANAPGFGLGVSGRVDLRGAEPERSGIVVNLPKAAEIRGAVTGTDGKPVSGAQVIASGAHRGLALRPPPVRTDRSGRYVLDSLPSGEWNIAVLAPGHAPSGRAGLSVQEGETVSGADFSLVVGRVLAGLIVDAKGRPVVSEPVQVSSLDFPVAGVAQFGTRTDAAGRFRLVHLPDLACTLSLGSEWVGPYRQEVHPDESPLTLRVEVLGDLCGRVTVSGDGEVPMEFTVYAIPTGASTPYPTWIAPSPYRTVRDSENGEFTIRGLQPGVYDVIALAGGERFSNRVNRIRVRPASAAEIGAPLVLERTGRVEGRVVDATGKPVGGTRVALLTLQGAPAEGWGTTAETSSSGPAIYQFRGIRAGKFILRATAPDGRTASVEVEIVPGKRLEADLKIH